MLEIKAFVVCAGLWLFMVLGTARTLFYKKEGYMFFIFGSPRSGTTILAQCLSAHPEIYIPDESDFIVPVTLICGRIREPEVGRALAVGFICNSERFKLSLGRYLAKSEIEKIVNSVPYDSLSIIDALYQAVACVEHKKIGGDKTPNDLLYARSLFEYKTINASCKVIHIVRDLRDLMVSLNNTGWGDDFEDYFPRIWSSTNLYLNWEMKKRPENYFLIKYEDFVFDPERHLSEICKFLGVTYTQEMLLSENRDGRYKGVEHHKNIYRHINADSVGRFSNKTSDASLKKYMEQASEALVKFNYLE
jgi:hypothetical protein